MRKSRSFIIADEDGLKLPFSGQSPCAFFDFSNKGILRSLFNYNPSLILTEVSFLVLILIGFQCTLIYSRVI